MLMDVGNICLECTMHNAFSPLTLVPTFFSYNWEHSGMRCVGSASGYGGHVAYNKILHNLGTERAYIKLLGLALNPLHPGGDAPEKLHPGWLKISCYGRGAWAFRH